MNYRSIGFAILLTLYVTATLRAEKINVWPEGHAELQGVDAKQIPTLDLFHVKSDKPVAAVLVIPGGGYKHHSSSAWAQAKRCRELGIAAYVLRYRLPVNGHQHPVPLHDAQRAMRLIHANAAKWNIDPERIGVIGSSSGGHLASLLSNVNDEGKPKAEDEVERQSCRPAFTLLVAPVITFLKPHAHWPSRARMLGADATDEQASAISPERLVTKDTPPTVLIHGTADTLVVPQNSDLYAAACKAHDVPVELFKIEGLNHVGGGPELQAKKDAAFDRGLEILVPARAE